MPRYGVDDMGDQFVADKEAIVHTMVDDTDANVTKTQLGGHLVLSIADGVDASLVFNVNVPYDYRRLTSAILRVGSVATGTMRWGVVTVYGGCGENIAAKTENIAATDTAITATLTACLDLAPALTGISAEDNVGITFTRYGAHINDTLGNILTVLSFTLRYD